MNTKAKWFWFYSLMALLLLAGCERESEPSRPASKPQPMVNNLTNMGVDDSQAKTNAPKPQLPPQAAPKAPETAQNHLPPPAASQTPETVQKPAEVGVGKKGRGYGKGFIATPAASLWAVKERLVFQVQIPQAMQLFKAGNDNKGPKSHDEFMEKIIKENSIKLPELPEGDRYMYDPKTEQLMVESPKPE